MNNISTLIIWATINLIFINILLATDYGPAQPHPGQNNFLMNLVDD